MNVKQALKVINVGKSFLIDAQINNEDVINVMKWNCQTSIPNTKPGMIMIALANHAVNSIIL